MEYNKQYFDSGKEASKGKMSSFLKILPRGKVAGSSQKHLKLYLMDRWHPFRKCKKVLDIGCGEGEFLKLNPFNIQVYGAEVSKGLVTKLKKEGIKVSLEDLNKRLSYKKDSFDGVACFHVLEHIFDYSNAIKEIKRVLNNNGTLVIAVPSLKHFYDDYTHVKFFTQKSLYRLLRDNGFVDIKIKNGISQSRFIAAAFFFFPRARYMFEKLLGEISPFEIVAVCKNQK